MLAQRLAQRAREDATARAGRVARTPAMPVDADFGLVNEGELQRGVDALLQWWDSVRD